MAAAGTHSDDSRRLVLLRPGQPPAGAFHAAAAGRVDSTDLTARLVQALGSATAAYVDLAIAFDYGFPADQVDAWLGVLADAGINPVDVLGWASDHLELEAPIPAGRQETAAASLTPFTEVPPSGREAELPPEPPVA
jgi:hypothetical protein